MIFPCNSTTYFSSVSQMRQFLALAALSAVKAEGEWFCHGIDCPIYTNFSVDSLEIRNYEPALWASTNISSINYGEAVTIGFNRLFDYISEAEVDMTAPVRLIRTTIP
jgi:hypothetical protein